MDTFLYLENRSNEFYHFWFIWVFDREELAVKMNFFLLLIVRRNKA
jgi:hypothetical protein